MNNFQSISNKWTRFKSAARFAVGATLLVGLGAKYYQAAIDNRIYDNSMIYWKVKDIIVKEELKFDRQDIAKRIMTGKKLPLEMSFLDVLKTLELMAMDDRISGIVCDLSGPGQGFSISQTEEIHTILTRIKALKESFKLVAVTDSFDNQADYLFASKFDKIIMEPTGSISLPGFSTSKPFYKSLLDRIGIEFIATHAGAYKAFGTEFTEKEMPEKQRQNLGELLSDLNNIFFTTIAQALTSKTSRSSTIAQTDITDIQNQTVKKITGLIAELKAVNTKSAESIGNEIAFLLESLMTSPSPDPRKHFEILGMIQTLPNNIRSNIMKKVHTDMKNINAGIVEKTSAETEKLALLKTVSEISPIDNTEALDMKLVSNVGHKLYFTPQPNKKEIKGVQVMTFQKYFMNMKNRIRDPLPVISKSLPVNVGIVYLTGTIQRHTDKVVRALLQASSDNSVKAIVLRVDSGGGDVTVSDQIAETVHYIQSELHIPVIASYASVAASGGVYATAGCDVILSNKSTITGSIGVASIKPLFPKERLLEYGIGVEELEMSKSAKNASLFNRMDKEGEERMREKIENIYDRFKFKVSKGRKLSMDEVEGIAQGQVFTGQRAVKHKLVDSIGSFLDATRVARIAAGFPIASGKDIVFPKRKNFIETILSPDSSEELDIGKALADVVLERLEDNQHLGLEMDRSFNINCMATKELIVISSEADAVSLDGSEEVEEASEYESEQELDDSENEEGAVNQLQTIPKRLKLEVSSNVKRLGMAKSLSAYIPKKSISCTKPLKPLSKSSSAESFVLKPFKLPTISKAVTLSGGLRPGTTLGLRRSVAVMIHSLFDPNGDKAFIVYKPKIQLSEQEKRMQLTKFPGKPVQFEVEVVVDPLLARVLRPHQLEGVQFLYDCTTGRKADNAFGCIMADEMGLGKTLQCITLLWTLLKQSEIPGKPTIDKAVIACPSSLVKNWANELVKWLPGNRINPYSCDNKGTKEQTKRDIENFVSSKGRGVINPVLIISYDSLRNYSAVLQKTEIGLILCDEGHKLKNSDNLTYQAINAIRAKRRVILSGTPIQNDLTEYFSLLNFVIPDLFGTGNTFRRQYEIPILRGRDADASDADRKIGQERLTELSGIASKFIIRRTAELLTKYLPTKYEYIVFCKMTDVQVAFYRHFAKKGMKQLKEEGDKSKSKGGQDSLKAMTTMKKIVNHPGLLNPNDVPPSLVPEDFSFKSLSSEHSGKLILLENMLKQIKSDTGDKIVLISNYTSTLDVISSLCQSKGWAHCRLDGTMTINKRQKLVDEFNDPEGRPWIFLLSSKAGGCGINLIGGNRLILFDPDWNPANDAQAMARVWRDGQKKVCFLYRFICTGTIEEKIFQRQAHKQALSSSVVDEEQDVERHFSAENLRQLFQLNEITQCDTHDTFKCKRCKEGKQIIKPPEGIVNTGATAADTSTWNHFSEKELNKIFDSVLLKQAIETKTVTYCFQNKSHDSIVKPS